jgi:hypothetical protein
MFDCFVIFWLLGVIISVTMATIIIKTVSLLINLSDKQFYAKEIMK